MNTNAPNLFTSVDLKSRFTKAMTKLGTTKIMVLTTALLLFSNIAFSQRSLKITKMREITYNTYSRQWDPWPSDWRSYSEDNQPVMTLYRLDNSGYKFRVNVQISGKEYSFDVTYTGYDDTNRWYKYVDADGNNVNIVGATMSQLATNGWPDSEVNIYFWIYTENFALELY